MWTIHGGDVLEVLRGLEAGGFDACMCDPPYGLSFMGKSWDGMVPSAEVWKEVLWVLLVPFSGSGSEMIGALRAGWEVVEGIELQEDYRQIARNRLRVEGYPT